MTANRRPLQAHLKTQCWNGLFMSRRPRCSTAVIRRTSAKHNKTQFEARCGVSLPLEQQFGAPPLLPHLPRTNELKKKAAKKRTRSPTPEKTAKLPSSTSAKQPFQTVAQKSPSQKRRGRRATWSGCTPLGRYSQPCTRSLLALPTRRGRTLTLRR